MQIECKYFHASKMYEQTTFEILYLSEQYDLALPRLKELLDLDILLLKPRSFVLLLNFLNIIIVK